MNHLGNTHEKLNLIQIFQLCTISLQIHKFIKFLKAHSAKQTLSLIQQYYYFTIDFN